MEDARVTRRGVLAGSAVAAAGAAGVWSSAPAHAARAARSGYADLVVTGGRVLRMNSRFQTGEALAIRDGRVLAVGRTRDIVRLAGPRTQVIDAAGGTVLPGINDSHLHLSGFALTLPPLSYNVDAATIEDLVAVVQGAVAAAATPDEWIRGQGWNDNRLPRPPSRTDLDAVSGDHPVILTDFSFHAVAVNSKVLLLAGITRDTQPPPGGVIEKDAAGEPTGVLRETAQGLVASVVPPRTSDEISTGIDLSMAVMHAQGITSLTDPGISLDTLAIYAAKARDGQLPLRINTMLSAGNSIESLQQILDGYRPLRGVDPRHLRVAAVKIFADGIPTAARTAWLHEPYVDGSNGSLVVTGSTIDEQVATLHTMIKKAVDAGFQVGTHATGDATIDAVVAGYLKAMGPRWRRTDLRHYVIHGDLTPPATLRTMASHDIGVNMNGTIKYLLGRTLDPVIGPERTDYQWPYRTALDLGVRVSSSSDAPVTFPSWLQGVMGARLREGMFGGVAGEAERISVPEALATYTRTPAWQDHAASWKGTLEPGRVADVCVVGGDVLGVDPHELVNLKVTATILGGDVVYDASGSTARRAATASAAARTWTHQRSASCLDEGLCCCKLVEKVSGPAA
jgi:predicted amidohydrolase YtcJ